MSTASAKTSDPALWRRRRLSFLGIAALIWVSFGSWSMIVWAGVDWRLAIAYPLIVDAGVVFVMPFYTDAALPDSKDWPIRSHARRTIVGTFAAIVIFNALHTVIEAMNSTTLPGWVRPVIALIAGVVPVVLYIRSAALGTLVSAWEVHDAKDQARIARESRENEAREARESQLRDEREQAAYQRELERDQAERDAKLAEIRVRAEADERVIRARESAGNSRVTSRPAAAVAVGEVDPKLVELAAEMPAGNRSAKAIWLTEAAWDAGLDPTSADIGRAGGFDRKLASMARKELADRGVVPPSERAPKLALASR